ncbi:MAG: hypothetical protein JW820_10675 [Spirochaetales bacterium]|nr:hypothetical protein [Spirochaetales bacterium]
MSEQLSSFDDFLAWERASRDTIDLKKIYIDVCGDLNAGLMLSQLIYWCLPDAEGESKLRVYKNGIGWVAKSRAEWWEETRQSPREVDRAKTILVRKGFAEVNQFRFDGLRTDHYRLLPEGVLAALNEILRNPLANPYKRPKSGPGVTEKGIPMLPKTEYPCYENCKTHVTENDIPTITKTTTKSTTETVGTPLQQTSRNFKKLEADQSRAFADEPLTFPSPTPDDSNVEQEALAEAAPTGAQSQNNVRAAGERPEPWMYTLATRIDDRVWLTRKIVVHLAAPTFRRMRERGLDSLEYVEAVASRFDEPCPTEHLISEINRDLNFPDEEEHDEIRARASPAAATA